jgi:hypothetical protein
MTNPPTAREEANKLEADLWWSEAVIDHGFCKRCRPYALQLASLLGRAMRVIARLRCPNPPTPTSDD